MIRTKDYGNFGHFLKLNPRFGFFELSRLSRFIVNVTKKRGFQAGSNAFYVFFRVFSKFARTITFNVHNFVKKKNGNVEKLTSLAY